ncbi:MAG: prepilin-type N-terminal cleavage/methylation domain-containing protein, partial [Planctomycetota bacterium]|nr:prepilin-type N-terminal cleavage/methylation domain-containing protein [Planctomycetota bacterium]
QNAAMESRGFTLVELLVASAIVAMCAAWTLSLYRSSMDMAAQTGARWRGQSSSEVVVDSLAGSVEMAMNLPDIPTLVVETRTDGGSVLICQAGMERRRFCCQKLKPDDAKYQLTLQRATFAGMAALSRQAAPQDEEAAQKWDEERTWADAPMTVIGHDLDGMSVAIQKIGQAKNPDPNRFRGPSGDLLVTIQAGVGGQQAARTVYARANAVITAGGGG